MSMFKTIIILCHLLTLRACQNHSSHDDSITELSIKKPKLCTSDSLRSNTLETRFKLPNGFERIKVGKNSFAQYLRQLPLKPMGSLVKYYNGSTKSNNNIYLGVVDLNIGHKNLHQCADAIMRLKAEFHWHRKEYEKIHFNFTNGFRVDYNTWRKGSRIAIDGNRTSWIKNAKPASNDYKIFWSYLEMIFTYAGTASLSKELQPVPWNDILIGDVLIQGGHPGHAAIIVDIAVNKSTDEKMFMLAQSYMPAQELQILVSQNNSPWYSHIIEDEIRTPEWIFNKTDLKRFRN